MNDNDTCMIERASESERGRERERHSSSMTDHHELERDAREMIFACMCVRYITRLRDQRQMDDATLEMHKEIFARSSLHVLFNELDFSRL